MHHVLTPSYGRKSVKPRDTTGPNWPNYNKGDAQFLDTSANGRVSVYVDPSLGSPGFQNARDLISDADRIVQANDNLFASVGGPVNVLVFALGGATDGTGGADHMGCDYETGADIEVCASFGNSARVSALFEAELSECSMGGELCGRSTGEALSRWCASVVSNNALFDFATAPLWAEDGMPDYVNQTDLTDRNADSTGCGMAFLSWLMGQSYGLDQIAQTMVALGDSGTLAQLYSQLTGKPASRAWPEFQTALQALPDGVTTDDPFGGATQPPQLAHLAPWTVELAGKVFAAILGDLAAGKTANQVVATVRAILVSAPATKSSVYSKVCQTKSRRLIPPNKVDRT